MPGSDGKGLKSLRQNPFERIDVRLELDKLDRSIEELRLNFEQYFTGLLPLAPDRLHGEVKRHFRRLLKAPFKNSEMSFRLKTLEGRYHTLNSYWQRVLREREAGTYVKDVFKANLRERFSLEDQRSQTSVGAAEKGIQNLFNSYREAIEKQTGQVAKIDYQKFQKAIVQRAKEFKAQNEGKKVSFKIVLKNGKVTIEARAKKKEQAQ